MAEMTSSNSGPVEVWITGIGLATSLGEGLDTNWDALNGQRIGTYAAGLALDSAGVKGNKEILARMDMIVAAGGGERDLAVDCSILTAESNGNAAPGFLNERLMNDLRPTLFLAQLSNLLAGNIAIVHGVTGSSRTFMGEEAAGVDAASIAPRLPRHWKSCGRNSASLRTRVPSSPARPAPNRSHPKSGGSWAGIR